LGWAANIYAHGESFIPVRSGRLRAIELAIEPSYVHAGRETTAGDATVFVARDESGFPGPVLERFRVAAVAPTAPSRCPALLKSLACPPLQAGVKYWLCAGSAGGWVWHDNPRDFPQASACEREPGKWISGGNGRNAAFAITVTEELEDVSK